MSDSYTLQPGIPTHKVDKKGNFITRYVDGKTLFNIYDCDDCKKLGIEHEIQSYNHGATDNKSCWGGGVPTTIRVCSNCGKWDGPWVSSSIVGGWY